MFLSGDAVHMSEWLVVLLGHTLVYVIIFGFIGGLRSRLRDLEDQLRQLSNQGPSPDEDARP